MSEQWKELLLSGLRSRSRRESAPFTELIRCYRLAKAGSYTPPPSVGGTSAKEMQLLEEKIVELRKDLAKSYEINSKHAQSIIECMEKTKAAEARAQALQTQLEILANERDTLEDKLAKTSIELEKKTQGFEAIKEDSLSRQAKINELEIELVEKRNQLYEKNKKMDVYEERLQHMETQLCKNAEMVNLLTEELSKMSERGATLSPTPQPSSSPSQNDAKRNRSTSTIGSTPTFDAVELVSFQEGIPQQYCRNVTAHSEGITSIAYNMHGRVIATSSNDSKVRLWDSLSTFSICCFETGVGKSVKCVSIASDDRTLACGTASNSAMIFSMKGKLMHTMQGHRDTVSAVSYVDSISLVTGSYDRTVRLWDCTRGSLIAASPSVGSKVNDVASTPLNVFVVANNDGYVRLLDTRTLEESGRISCHQGIVASVVCSTDYRYFLSTGRDNTLQYIDSRMMEVVRELKTMSGNFRTNGCLSGCGNYAVVGNRDGSLLVWETATGNISSKIKPKFNGSPLSLRVAPTGFQLAVGCEDGSLLLWER